MFRCCIAYSVLLLELILLRFNAYPSVDGSELGLEAVHTGVGISVWNPYRCVFRCRLLIGWCVCVCMKNLVTTNAMTIISNQSEP